jgi:hypothetical protein
VFSKPKSGTSYVAPAEAIDVNQRYLVKLIEIKDEGVSQFADPADPDPKHNLRWVFQMAHLDRTPIKDVDGNPYEHHDYTSNRTGKGKTKTATARTWMEALLGRPVDDDEIDDSLPRMLQNKVATALFEEKERGGQDGQESYMRLKILRLNPYKGGTSTPAVERTAPPPAPAPRREPEPVAAGSDLPW